MTKLSTLFFGLSILSSSALADYENVITKTVITTKTICPCDSSSWYGWENKSTGKSSSASTKSGQTTNVVTTSKTSSTSSSATTSVSTSLSTSSSSSSLTTSSSGTVNPGSTSSTSKTTSSGSTTSSITITTTSTSSTSSMMLTTTSGTCIPPGGGACGPVVALTTSGTISLSLVDNCCVTTGCATALANVGLLPTCSQSASTTSSGETTASSTSTGTLTGCSTGISAARSSAIVSSFSSSGVVPTLVPNGISPRVEVSVTYQTLTGLKAVELGNEFSITETTLAPLFSFNSEPGFPEETTKYMLFMVDPDVPMPGGTATVPAIRYLHWAVYDAQADCVQDQNRMAAPFYQNPSPASIEPHRYTFLLYRQPADFQLTVTDRGNLGLRAGFDLDNFVVTKGLTLVGGNFFLEGLAT